MSLSADYRAHIPAVIRKTGYSGDYKVSLVKDGVMRKSVIPHMVDCCQCDPAKHKNVFYPEHDVRITMRPIDLEVDDVGLFRYWVGRCPRCEMFYVAGTLLKPY